MSEQKITISEDLVIEIDPSDSEGFCLDNNQSYEDNLYICINWRDLDKLIEELIKIKESKKV